MKYLVTKKITRTIEVDEDNAHDALWQAVDYVNEHNWSQEHETKSGHLQAYSRSWLPPKWTRFL